MLWFSLGVALLLTGFGFLVPREASKSQSFTLDPQLLENNRAAIAKLNLRNQEEHPVTAAQARVAASTEGKLAPDFELESESGDQVRLSSLTKRGPVLIYFIEKNCPCCLGAKYFIERMHDLYQDSLTTIGVINASRPEATKWKEATRATFPLLLDPQLNVIKQYEASRGVYTTLVSQEGKIAAAYPGYGKEMLVDLSEKIASLAKVEPRPYRALAAPDRLTSGCKFPEPKK